MASYWQHEHVATRNAAAVDEFARLAGQITPRLRVRLAFGLQHALTEAHARHDAAEAATLTACLRRLRPLLHDHET